MPALTPNDAPKGTIAIEIRVIAPKTTKLVLAYKVYTSNEYSSSCFIYDADIESNKLFLYFPEEKVTIRTSIIHNKINHMYDIKIVYNIIQSNMRDKK